MAIALDLDRIDHGIGTFAKIHHRIDVILFRNSCSAGTFQADDPAVDLTVKLAEIANHDDFSNVLRVGLDMDIADETIGTGDTATHEYGIQRAIG